MNKEALAWGGNGLAIILTTIQTNVIFQYISLFLTILATLLSVIISCYNLIQKVKNQEKIDQKDVSKLLEELKEAQEKIKDLEDKQNE